LARRSETPEASLAPSLAGSERREDVSIIDTASMTDAEDQDPPDSAFYRCDHEIFADAIAPKPAEL